MSHEIPDWGRPKTFDEIFQEEMDAEFNGAYDYVKEAFGGESGAFLDEEYEWEQERAAQEPGAATGGEDDIPF